MFAKIYDLLMSDVDYDALLLLIKPYIKKDSTIIDAGCGTGYLLKALIENGYDAIGIDIDDEMLAIAQEKLMSNHLKAPLFHHDLRRPMHMKVDVVISLFDVMNYFKGVKQVIMQIKNALNKDGIFIFDVYRYDVLERYDGYHETEDDPIHYDWQMNTSKERLIHEVKFDGYHHHLTQYIRPISYYTKILEDVGFKNYKIISGPDERKHYIIASL
jgi:SAM-dependent methyltransferase